MSENTLFLRLAGPMQSWGTSSRFQLRRTDAYPSRSGVLGLLLCAKGIRREDSPKELPLLALLSMGLRVDRPGATDWDYHTAGGGHGHGTERAIGIRRAKGGIKKTGTTGKYETLLSRRQYLWDASFLVALRGDANTVRDCATMLEDPAWPLFLGRKCCIPAEPVFAGKGAFESVTEALSSVAWCSRIDAVDREDRNPRRRLDAFIECAADSAPPEGARPVHDVPRAFGYYSHGPRFVVATQVTVPVAKLPFPSTSHRGWVDPYGPGWDELRAERLKYDHDLCVFCKSPAVEVHHLDYSDVRLETIRSLCKLCHGACTMHEYGNDMRQRRIDPADANQRPLMLQSIEKLLQQRRFSRRSELLEAGRTIGDSFFDDATI